MLSNVLTSANNAIKGLDKVGPSDLLGMPSITGGAAAPSSAVSTGPTSYVAMNNPFSFADDGGKASATAENAGALDPQVLILLAIIGGIVLVALK